MSAYTTVVCSKCGCVYDAINMTNTKCPDCSNTDILCSDFNNCEACKIRTECFNSNDK